MKSNRARRGQARGHRLKPIASDPKLAVLLCRVSSEKQTDGFSLDVQERRGREYAARNGFQVTKVLRLTETAYREEKRDEFIAFLEYIKTNPEKHILVSVVDRISRNRIHLAEVDRIRKEFDKAFHFYDAGYIIDRNAKSSDLLRLDMEGAIANFAPNQQGEKVRNSLEQMVMDGYWPGKAPFGYRNVGGVTRRKMVEPHPDEAHWHVRIKQLAATRNLSINAIIDRLEAEGCALKIARNLVERVIRHPFATGWMPWRGKLYKGKHKPLIDWALHEAAIAGLERMNKPKYRQHDWPYSGLAECGLDGRAIVFETKKKPLKSGAVNLHTYAHCSGVRYGDNDGCKNPYLKYDDFEAALADVVRPIEMKPEVVDWIITKLGTGADKETLARETELATLRRELAKLKTYVERAYEDKVAGKIAEDFWLQQTRQWQESQIRVEEAIRKLEESGPTNYLAVARQVLEPTIGLTDKYFSLAPHKRATVLRIVCSNLKQAQKNIVPVYRSPYDILARGNASGNWLRD